MEKSTNEWFIEKAKTVHGDKYDYSLVEYSHSKTRIKIICPIHGVFEQTPNNHLKGGECLKCSIEKRKKTNISFLNRVKEIHGNRYDYSLVEYINYDFKIKIICPIHGVFEQTPANHLNGVECLLCSRIKRQIGVDEFIRKSNIKHNDIYDYSLVEYSGIFNRVKIICPKHGRFEQTPANHLKGHGCPLCNESRGELKVSVLLDENNIKYVKQYRFKNCKSIKPLPFDFYLPDFNTCIEFNGIQHYKPVEHFGGLKEFKKLKKRDYIKSDYCFKNNIKLVVIKYNESVNKIIKILRKNE